MKMLVLFPMGAEYCELLERRLPMIEWRFKPNGTHTMDDMLWCDAVTGHPPRDELRRAPNVKWVHIQSAGVDGYADRSVYAREDVIVTRTADTFGVAIAEHTLGMMLALVREFPYYMRRQAEHAWGRREPHGAARSELGGAVVLMLGMGSLAGELLPLLAPFGCEIIGVRRDASKPAAGYDAVYATQELKDALARADFVVSTLPLTAATRHILGEQEFAAMKRGAFLVNVGRGGTVDHDALASALASGYLGGAGLDVTEPEPLPADSPLWDLPNVFITPHSSGLSTETWRRRAELLASQCERYLAGEELLWRVDFEAGY